MTTDRVIVTLLGMGAIAATLWYFLRTRIEAATERARSSYQEVQVNVKGGYTPDTILAEQGRPLRIRFLREETAPCSDTVVFPAFGVREELPAHRVTTVEISPDQPGEFEFTCGMGMLKGRLIVEEGRVET